MILSNLAWLLPTAIAWLGGAYGWMVAAVVMMGLSIAYHQTYRLVYETIDTIAAVLFLLAGPVILWHYDATLREWILVSLYFGAAVGIYVRARTRKKRAEYLRWHIIWHVAGAVLCAVVYWCAFW